MSPLLTDLSFLILDCQTTGASPQTGHLLELGWLIEDADHRHQGKIPPVTTSLVRLPAKTGIPHRIERMTGIDKTDLQAAADSADVWQALWKDIQPLMASDANQTCPSVVHYARFELPFIRQLHAAHSAHDPFPFEFICSHTLLKKLCPQLTCHSLRAVAGYFGYSVPEQRRAREHVLGTLHIWRQAIRLLANEIKVHTLEELKHFIQAPLSPNVKDQPAVFNKPDLSAISNQPGVYWMRRSNGDLLYIGKAKSLRKRVRSYFHRRPKYPTRLKEMLCQIAAVDVTETKTALEAALLESDAIKQYAPPYNQALRKGRRCVSFFSKDFTAHSFRADAGHPIGPVPTAEALQPLAAIGQLVSLNSDMNHCPATALGIDAKWAPDADVFKEGFDLFRKHYQFYFETKPYHRALMLLGAQLWRDKLIAASCQEEAEPEVDDDITGTDEDNSETMIWTPEHVAGALAGAVCRCAHLIRRGRWLVLISEAVLSWQQAKHQRRVMVISRGAVHSASTQKIDQSLPHPVRYPKPLERQSELTNLASYDRLRVLTTELRRLLAENRDIRLRVGRHMILGPEQIAKALQWV